MRALAILLSMTAWYCGGEAQSAPATPPGSGLPATWSPAPAMLEGRAAHAVVVADGAVYAMAGIGSDGRPVLAVERFDGRAWRHETHLPGHGLNAPAAAVIGQRIYLIGGFDTTTNVPTAQVLVYDTHARRWSTAAPLPRPLGSPAAVVHEGALYSIGGRSGLDDFGNVWRYDAGADRWVTGTAIAARGTHGAVSTCGSVYVFGGESQPQERVLGEVLRLDAAHDAWIELAPMPTPRNFARAVLYGGAVWVAGGSLSPGSSHESAGSRIVERFDPGCRP